MSLKHRVELLTKEQLTHNVIRFEIEKPDGFEYKPGYGLEVSIDHPSFADKAAPFTLTSLNSDRTLELVIKIYPENNGMTLGLSKLNIGDHLLIGDSWGSFSYSGQGVFIAGGSGVTPFLAILRQLKKDGLANSNHLLLFANNTEEDIIMKDEFTELLGDNFINVLSKEVHKTYSHGLIDRSFLKRNFTDFTQQFYLCGPGGFSKDITTALIELGASVDNIHSEY